VDEADEEVVWGGEGAIGDQERGPARDNMTSAHTQKKNMHVERRGRRERERRKRKEKERGEKRERMVALILLTLLAFSSLPLHLPTPHRSSALYLNEVSA
jgi:hypothetical protein